MAIVPSTTELVPGDCPPEPGWQHALAAAVRDPVQLCRTLQLPARCEPAARRAAESFPVLVPREYLARIRPGDPTDPLLRQVLPLDEELDQVAGYQADPVGDAAATRCPGLLQKYPGRALMVTAGVCAVHCRFCFRRHFPYDSSGNSRRWTTALAALQRDASIREVILSGGDPLMVTDSLLAQLLQQLAALPHVRRVRIHTRLPIVIPQRVTPQLPATLRATRLPVIMVLHVNHPRELDATVADHLARLVDGGIPLLNQSVLLRGVNDHLETLVELSERLVDLRVVPYYLHQLDRVQGAAHFAVPVSRGRELLAQLRTRLPGYAVPRYVQDRPAALSKLEIGAECVTQGRRDRGGRE